MKRNPEGWLFAGVCLILALLILLQIISIVVGSGAFAIALVAFGFVARKRRSRVGQVDISARRFIHRTQENQMDGNVIYEDPLITLYTDSLRVKNYYFLFLGTKRVSFADISSIRVEEPTLFSGKWRLQGTRDFRTWFPLDVARPIRDKIFIVELRQKRMRIGFTVRDSGAVMRLLAEKGLLSLG